MVLLKLPVDTPLGSPPRQSLPMMFYVLLHRRLQSAAHGLGIVLVEITDGQGFATGPVHRHKHTPCVSPGGHIGPVQSSSRPTTCVTDCI